MQPARPAASTACSQHGQQLHSGRGPPHLGLDPPIHYSELARCARLPLAAVAPPWSLSLQGTGGGAVGGYAIIQSQALSHPTKPDMQVAQWALCLDPRSTTAPLPASTYVCLCHSLCCVSPRILPYTTTFSRFSLTHPIPFRPLRPFYLSPICRDSLPSCLLLSSVSLLPNPSLIHGQLRIACTTTNYPRY